MTVKFSEMPYSRPDVNELCKTIADLTEQFNAAKSAEEAITILQAVNKASENAATMGTLAHIRNTINTKDEFYAAERAYFDEAGPLITQYSQNFILSMLKSPYREALEKELGNVVFINAEMAVKCFSPEIIPLLQEEAALTTEYQKLYASAQIPFNGSVCTIAQLSAFKESADRDVRKAALEAEGKFFDDNRQKFDELFDKLVKNRTEQAHKLGFENYVPLGYLHRQRNCYGPREVENFRKQIVEDIVPIVNKIKDNQKKRIGIDDFKFWDNAYSFADGNPTPKGTPDELLAAAKKMYSEMSEETREFIETMFDMELFDVVAKDGKAPGGYCTDIPEYKVPFVFSNFNGTSADVDVLTHEMGHAFAGYTAYRKIKYDDCRTPSMEGAETHSMTMEFLTMPWHELFFKEDTAKYELAHAEDALIFLPYGTMVDHFQEIVYSHPELTPEQRNEEWAKLEKIYRPYIDFDNLPFYSRGAGWQRQLHIYLYPFYYIDYCMAQTVALEFFSLYLEDPEEAKKRYFNFVDMGGTKTFADLVKSVGLKTPLEDGALAFVAKHVDKWLDENQI